MNIFADFDARIKKTLQDIDLKSKDGGELDLSRVGVEPPRDATHGDIATNAAMVLSKAVGQNPRELASRIAEALKADADVESVDVAGPGFINLRLKPTYWQRELAQMLNEGPDFGRSKLGHGHKVNVEYVSANPTGPMHVGHCRGAVVGDVLANLLKFAGYDVVKEYYINDAGAQIDVFDVSAGYDLTAAWYASVTYSYMHGNAQLDNHRANQVTSLIGYRFSKRTTVYVDAAYQIAYGAGAKAQVNASTGPSGSDRQFIGTLSIQHTF